MAAGRALASLSLISIGIIVLLACPAGAADQLEVFVGQDKLVRLGTEVVFNDAKLVRPDPPDPMKTYEFSWDFDASVDLDRDGVFDNDDEAPLLLTVHNYTLPGVYTVTLTVTDNTGGTAKDTCVVTVVDSEPPVAQIVSIAPNPATEGANVTFTGSGTDIDGSIVEYDWTMEFGGVEAPLPSNTATFTTDALPLGVCTIKLRVRDDDGLWSEPVTATLRVEHNQPPTITVLTTRTRTDAGTTVDFVVRYTDPEGDVPASCRFFLGTGRDFKVQDLAQVDEADANYTDGKDYHYRTRLRVTGNYSYYFEFHNPENGRVVSPDRFIDVTEPRGFAPGSGPVAVVAAMLLAVVGARSALPDRRRPSRCERP